MSATCDVAVIGASISGATVAGFLGRTGIRVDLIDRDVFPRRKACGEGLSEIAIEALGRLGLAKDLSSIERAPFYSYRIDLGGRDVVLSSPGRQRLKGVGIQRWHLDRLLVEHARKMPSVALRLGSGVDDILESDDGYSIRLRSGVRIKARRLVLADGSNSGNAARLKIPKVNIGRELWGISFLLEGSFLRQTGEVVVILKDGFEINCTPVGRRHLNLAFLAEKERVLPLQDPAWRSELLEEAKRKCGFQGGPTGKPLQIGPVGTGRRPYSHRSIYLVGDAAQSLDPIAGMGMTHGILTAECAARHLLMDLSGQADRQEAAEAYQLAAKKLAGPYRGFTNLTASLLRSRARRVLVPCLAAARMPEMVRASLGAGGSGRPSMAMAMHLLLTLVGG
jgi:flavin-dependent dehydrogenase